MTEDPTGPYPTALYPTALGAASKDEITLLGHDLARDVMGEVSFGELAFWLAAQRRPTPGETRVFEAVLAALADHGYTPTAIISRLALLSAPDSVQGALAAGLLAGARGSSASPRTADGSCTRCWSRTRSRRTTPAGTPWPWRP